jgi:hypothetical protein
MRKNLEIAIVAVLATAFTHTAAGRQCAASASGH